MPCPEHIFEILYPVTCNLIVKHNCFTIVVNSRSGYGLDDQAIEV